MPADTPKAPSASTPAPNASDRERAVGWLGMEQHVPGFGAAWLLTAPGGVSLLAELLAAVRAEGYRAGIERAAGAFPHGCVYKSATIHRRIRALLVQDG